MGIILSKPAHVVQRLHLVHPRRLVGREACRVRLVIVLRIRVLVACWSIIGVNANDVTVTNPILYALKRPHCRGSLPNLGEAYRANEPRLAPSVRSTQQSFTPLLNLFAHRVSTCAMPRLLARIGHLISDWRSVCQIISSGIPDQRVQFPLQDHRQARPAPMASCQMNFSGWRFARAFVHDLLDASYSESGCAEVTYAYLG